MQPNVLLAIPSRNEADSISRVATDCDTALAKTFGTARVLMLNVDSGSDDGTPDVFMATKTAALKKSIRLPQPGKGRCIAALARYAVDHTFDAVMIVDADVAAVCPTWIDGLLAPILKDERDCAFARRPPLWNRGDLTYHLCAPFMAGVFGALVREPISPTQVYSRAIMQQLLETPLDADMLEFGIDIRLAALAAERNWVEVVLNSPLQHKLRSFSSNGRITVMSNDKFCQVLRTIRTIYRENRARDTGSRPIENSTSALPPSFSFGVPGSDVDYDDLVVGMRAARERMPARYIAEYGLQDWHTASGDDQGLDWAVWRWALKHWMQKPAICIDETAFMQDLLLNRCVGFYREVQGRTDWFSIVERQALDFHGFMKQG
jgi:glycosyltransferase involved in cell wall biosynthesis